MASTDRSRAAPSVAVNPARPQSHGSLVRQQRIWGWIFLSPWIIGFVIFWAAPIIASFVFTFLDFNLSNPDATHFVGLKNWQRLLSDPLTLQSLSVTFRFALIAVPVGLLLPLGVATLLNSKQLYGKRIWRLLFYLPYMVPAISSIFIWQSFLNGQSGWLNRILTSWFGLASPPNWLQDEGWILVGFLLIGVWGIGNAMLTMLATMQGVPTELYEAADVDGANAITKWFRITLPMISPVVFYNLVLSVIGLMQYFVVPYVITRGTGNPNNSAYFFNMHLYKTAFTFSDMGYGATLAWLIFIVALAVTILLFATSRRWVYYSSGD